MRLGVDPIPRSVNTTFRNSASSIASVIEPLRAALSAPNDAVLAIVCQVEGPSYRPLGAMMTVLNESEWVGSLSSGCIESDIALHACAAHKSGKCRRIRYGKGSPFLDIQLPCGGGLEILLVPHPNAQVLGDVIRSYESRRSCTLRINIHDGEMTLGDETQTARLSDLVCVRIQPEILFQVFGKGPEASTFAALAQAAGYPNILLSPDRETLELAGTNGCHTQYLPAPRYLPTVEADSRTAITLFFHDHDWEPSILLGALRTPAFYIGAQGSRRAAVERSAALSKLGVPAQSLARIHGPMGLIPSTRDPRTLAVSVLAEVLFESNGSTA